LDSSLVKKIISEWLQYTTLSLLEVLTTFCHFSFEHSYNNTVFFFPGGTAGCLIANRLVSTKKTPSVLIIEIGDHGDVKHRVPYARYLNVFTRPDLNYAYVTAPQTALDNKVLSYARGKGMGGSSMINFMVYTRGAAGDYDEWAKLVGSDDWSWNAALKRFHKVGCFASYVLSMKSLLILSARRLNNMLTKLEKSIKITPNSDPNMIKVLVLSAFQYSLRMKQPN
jgi:hypothetical protein